MSEELTKQDERPAFLQNYEGDVNVGMEDVTSTADMVMPFISIGQSMTEQVASGELPPGSIFCPNTGEVFVSGKEKPMLIYPVYYWKNFIRWGERDDENPFLEQQPAGGVAEESVRQRKMIKRKDGKEDYEWTQYNNYAVLVETAEQGLYDDWYVLSCYRTNIQASRRFNTMIKRKLPIFSARYTVQTKVKKNKLGQFFVYDFDNAGYVTNEDLFKRLQALNAEVNKIKDDIVVAVNPPNSSEAGDGVDEGGDY